MKGRKKFDVVLGKYYMCIQSVVMDDDNEIAYKFGHIYKSEYEGCITDEDGCETHYWKGVDYLPEHFREATEEEVKDIERINSQEFYDKSVFEAIIRNNFMEFCYEQAQNIKNTTYEEVMNCVYNFIRRSKYYGEVK